MVLFFRENNMKKVSFEKGLHQLTKHVYTYLLPPGTWGLNNAGLIVDDKSVLIDTLYDIPSTQILKNDISKVIGTEKAVDYVINTHANGDHFYGNSLFKDSTILSTKICADEMLDMLPKKMEMFQKLYFLLGKAGKYFNREFKRFKFSGIETELPSRTFKDEFILNLKNLEVHLKDLGPVHTKSDVVVHIPEEKVIFAADILFINGTPIIWEGPYENMMKACDYIIGTKSEYIVPGHGPVAVNRDVEKVKSYCSFIYEKSIKCNEKGMSVYDASVSIDLGEYKQWHHPERIVLNINAFYREFDPSFKGFSSIKLFGLMEKYYQQMN